VSMPEGDGPQTVPVDGGSPHRPLVIVGVDGSGGARAALVWAMAEAARRGAELEVVSAAPVDFYWTDPYLVDGGRLEEVRTDTEERARALVEDVRHDPAVTAVPDSAGVPVRVVVVAEPAAELLVRRAEEADLLVIGSRGRSGVRSTLLGSVALHCATHARCLVVVVHPLPQSVTAAGGKVVVGLDDSDTSREALRHAVRAAAGLGADVEGVVAYHELNPWSGLYTLGAPPVGELREHARRRGEDMVAEVVSAVSDGPRPNVRVVAAEGPAADVLIRRAEGAALLVVGSRSRSRLVGMVLGSVALECVVHAPCPVMVVHPGIDARTAAPLAAPALG